MADTIKRVPYKAYSKESADNRRQHERKIRHAVKIALAQGDEALPTMRRTQGWMTH